MSGTTRDLPDAKPSAVITRSRRRAIESSSEDGHSSEDATGPMTPISAHARRINRSGTPVSEASAPSNSPDPLDLLWESPSKRPTAASIDRSSPTKASNPFSTTSLSSALRRVEATRSKSPTRPADAIAAKLAAARQGGPLSSAFDSQKSEPSRSGRRTQEYDPAMANPFMSSPTKEPSRRSDTTSATKQAPRLSRSPSKSRTTADRRDAEDSEQTSHRPRSPTKTERTRAVEDPPTREKSSSSRLSRSPSKGRLRTEAAANNSDSRAHSLSSHRRSPSTGTLPAAESTTISTKAPTRRKSLRSKPITDENDNPFAPAFQSNSDSDHKTDSDSRSERTQRLVRRRSLRGMEVDDAENLMPKESTPPPASSPVSVRVGAALARRTTRDPARPPSTKLEEAPAPKMIVEVVIPRADDPEEIARKERERQERLARRRSLYSYLPPKRIEADADAQEVDALLQPGQEKTRASIFDMPPTESSTLARATNPFVRTRPTTAGIQTETTVNDVKESFKRLSLEGAPSLDEFDKRSGLSPIRRTSSSRPPVSTPGLHSRIKERPQSSSLAAAVATLARGSRLPLRGCTILVDVRDMDGEDVSAPWIEKLKGAGARVYSRWPGERTMLTHVVWKSGRPSTLNMMRALEKEVERRLEDGLSAPGSASDVLVPGVMPSGVARRRSLKSLGIESSRTKALVQEDQESEVLSMPLIVGVGWAQACVAENRHVDEEAYLVEIGKEAIFKRRRRSSMAPKSAPPSPPGSETPRPTPSRGRKSLASSGLRSEIEKARKEAQQYAPVVSSPLRKRCFIDTEAFFSTPVAAG
ncbi:hypothetical protein OC861_001122 [Tilletia horrida]|nr:hypothetical protein OC861_001122 [Tilletia horrida]